MAPHEAQKFGGWYSFHEILVSYLSTFCKTARVFHHYTPSTTFRPCNTCETAGTVLSNKRRSVNQQGCFIESLSSLSNPAAKFAILVTSRVASLTIPKCNETSFRKEIVCAKGSFETRNVPRNPRERSQERTSKRNPKKVLTMYSALSNSSYSEIIYLPLRRSETFLPRQGLGKNF